jgi:hypothetical protein
MHLAWVKDDGVTALAPIEERFATSPICLPAIRSRSHSSACAPPRALAGRSEMLAFSLPSSGGARPQTERARTEASGIATLLTEAVANRE